MVFLRIAITINTYVITLITMVFHALRRVIVIVATCRERDACKQGYKSHQKILNLFHSFVVLNEILNVTDAKV